MAENVCLVFVSLSVWLYFFALLLAFKTFGVYIIMVWKMLVGDVLRFFVIYLLIALGFTTAFFCL
jgi:transient receptor potential cation channel subfamily V protein 5